MRKKLLLYILTMMITSFCFKNNVFAATELTCIYETPWTQQIGGIVGKNVTMDMVLVQDSEGNLEIYKADATYGKVDLEVAGWQRSNIKVDLNDSKHDVTSILDNEGHLTTCPQSEQRENGNPIFYAEKDKGKRNLTTSLTEVKKPKIYNVETKTGTFSGVSCNEINDEKKWIKEFNENIYEASCLYAHDTTNGCHIIQIDIKENGDMDMRQNEPKVNLGPNGYMQFNQEVESLNRTAIADNYTGYCPLALYVNRKVTVEQPREDYESQITEPSFFITTNVRMDAKSGYESYGSFGTNGKRLGTDEEQIDDVEIRLNFEKIKIESCEQLFGNSDELINMLKTIITVIKIIIPIILIGLGSLDFAQAVFSDSEDKMKKAQSKFIKRLIIGVVIFLIPSLIKVILGIAHSIWPNIDADLCGLL